VGEGMKRFFDEEDIWDVDDEDEEPEDEELEEF